MTPTISRTSFSKFGAPLGNMGTQRYKQITQYFRQKVESFSTKALPQTGKINDWGMDNYI